MKVIEKEKQHIFKKKSEEIELLTVFEAVKRYVSAHENFLIEERKKYDAKKLGQVYIPDKKFWNGVEGFKQDDDFIYLSLFNVDKDPKKKTYPFRYFVQKDGFHDEFKILRSDESKYMYEKRFYWENKSKYKLENKMKNRENYETSMKAVVFSFLGLIVLFLILLLIKLAE